MNEIERVARAIHGVKMRGHNPDCLYQHEEYEDWYVDDRREYADPFTGQPRIQLFHKAWRHYEKAATAAIAAMRGEPVGWQPIESAPRDGTAILAYGTMPGENARVNGWVCVRETKWRCYPKGSPGYARWETGDGTLGLGWDWYESVHNWAHTWTPTHWRPLPTPPDSGKD